MTFQAGAASENELCRGWRAGQQPEMPAVSADLSLVLDQQRRAIVPAISSPIRWLFADTTWLACIYYSDSGPATICFHSVLNQPATPPQVFEHIFIHELLHLRIPPREVEGKRTIHPPEFWEEEARLSPLRRGAWHWIVLAFWHVLREDKEREGVRVLRRWRRCPLVRPGLWQTVERDLREQAELRPPTPPKRGSLDPNGPGVF